MGPKKSVFTKKIFSGEKPVFTQFFMTSLSKIVKMKFDRFSALIILVGKSNISGLCGCVVFTARHPNAYLYMRLIGRCAMNSKRQNFRNDMDVLSQEQRYAVKETVFIVTPIFKVSGGDSLATALLRLMRNDVDNQ